VFWDMAIAFCIASGDEAKVDKGIECSFDVYILEEHREVHILIETCITGVRPRVLRPQNVQMTQ
jgi:hypothetical protein